MKVSVFAALFQRSSGFSTSRRRRKHRLASSACVSVESCEPRLLLSATGDDHVNRPGPDATNVAIDPANSSLTLTGVIQDINDSDVFQFNVPENTVAILLTDPPGPVGEPSLTATDSSSGRRVFLGYGSDVALSAGHWFFTVGGNPGFEQGTYSINLIVEAGQADDHPDFWGPDATVVPPGPAETPLTLNGRLGEINDKDFFQFQVDHAAEYTFEWRTDGDPAHGEVTIYDAFGFPKFNPGPGSIQLSEAYPLAAGQWWVMISGSPSFQSGDYSVTASFDDYPDSPSEVPDPNWQIFGPDTSMTGYFESPEDIDVLRFDVTRPSDLHLPSPVGVLTFVTDSSGNPVTLTGDNARLAPGSYFVSVKAAAQNADAAYSLSASLHPVFVAPVQITGGIGPSIDPTPNLTWSSVDGATSYDVYIGLTGDSKPVFRREGIEDTSFEVPVDLADGDYTVWIKALLPNKRQSIWGDGYSLQIGATPQFEGRSAATGDASWLPVAGAIRYEVWLGKVDQKTGARTRLLTESTTETTWQIPDSVSGGHYGVWVRAVGATANGTDHVSRWNAGEIFTLGDVVSAPVINNWKLTRYVDEQIADGGGLPGAASVISIGQAPNPNPGGNILVLPSAVAMGQPLIPPYPFGTSYEFRIIDAESGATLLKRSATETWEFQSDPVTGIRFVKLTYLVISWEDAHLLHGRETAVQVRTTSYPEFTNWSSLAPLNRRASQWSAAFPIAVGYSTGHISSHANSASGRPILSWPVAPDRVVLGPFFVVNHDPFRSPENTEPSPPRDFKTWGAHYDLWIDDTFSGAAIVRESSVLTNQFVVPDGLAPGVYSARVRATYDDGAVAVWSPDYRFQIMSDPVVITGGTEPTVDATPNIAWQAAASAKTYEVWIGLKGSNTPTYRITGETTTRHRVATPLDPGTYDVFVRATLHNGAVSRWGTAVTLQIGAPPVAKLQGRTVSWQAVNGATRYELWVNRVDEHGTLMAAKVINNDQIFGTSTTLPSQSGNFRVWIRAIRNEAGGTYYSGWSKTIEV